MLGGLQQESTKGLQLTIWLMGVQRLVGTAKVERLGRALHGVLTARWLGSLRKANNPSLLV